MPVDPEKTMKWIQDGIAERTARLVELLNTPGISVKVRKQAEMILREQERHTKEIERLLREK